MNDNSNTRIQMIADFEGDASVLIKQRERHLSYPLHTRPGSFPSCANPIVVGRKKSQELVNMLEQNPETIFCIFCQKKEDTEDPTTEDLSNRELSKTGEGHQHAQRGAPENRRSGPGPGKMQAEKHRRSPTLLADVESQPELWPSEKLAKEPMFKTLTKTFFEESIKFIKHNENIPDEAVYAINEISNIFVKCNFLCNSLPFSVEDRIKMLEEEFLPDRIIVAMKALQKELELLFLQSEIRRKTQYEMEEQQKEYFLKQQIKQIKTELGEGEGSPEKKELLEKAQHKVWNGATQAVFKKEMAKLDNIHPQSPDYPIQINYLQTLVDLPWNEYTIDNLSLTHAKKILNQDHYGMEKVKERILEYLAVRSLKNGTQSPILCLYGPPGVGKTSLGRSIAKAMNRKYVPCRSAVCTMSRRFAVIAAPTSVQCQDVSSRTSRKREAATQYSFSTR